jgi:hypothetical protein
MSVSMDKSTVHRVVHCMQSFSVSVSNYYRASRVVDYGLPLDADWFRRLFRCRACRVVDYALSLDADWFRRLFRYRASRDNDYGLLLDARLFLVATHSVDVAAAVRVSSLWPKQLPDASACAFWGALSSSSRL